MNTVPINEKLLQFIWQYGLFDKQNLFTTCDQAVMVLKCGLWNKDQGPDFLFSKIRIGQTDWIGHVEIHVLASHWILHGHSGDPHYSNVILHVVWEEDKSLNLPFPLLELKGRVSQWMMERYVGMMDSPQSLPCGFGLNTIAEIQVSKWLERMLVERISEKKNNVLRLAVSKNFHWEKVFGSVLASAMGGPKNSLAFERLIASVPGAIIQKLKNNQFAMEAFFLGWAGLLKEPLNDEYSIRLQKEYHYLKNKFKLQPPEVRLHFFRMRPSSFPTFRLALLAEIFTKHELIFNESFLERQSYEWQQIFQTVQLSSYWENHFIPGIPSTPHRAAISKTQITNLLINAVIPFMMAYSDYKGKQEDTARWLHWLQQLPAESNLITDFFQCHGLKPSNAGDTQALLHLKYQYCDLKNCLNCAFGKILLEKEIVGKQVAVSSV